MMLMQPLVSMAVGFQCAVVVVHSAHVYMRHFKLSRLLLSISVAGKTHAHTQ